MLDRWDESMCPLNTDHHARTIGLSPPTPALRGPGHRDNFKTFIDWPLQEMAIRIQ